MLRLKLTLILAVCMVSCSEEITYMAGYPGIELPDETNLLVVHRIDSTDKIKSSKGKNRMLHRGYAVFSKELNSSLSESGLFASVRDTIVQFEIGKAEFSKAMIPAQLQQIKEKSSFDRLLVIEKFDIYKNKSFSMSSDDVNTQSTDLITSVMFVLYTPELRVADRERLAISREIDAGEFDVMPDLIFSPAMKKFEGLIHEMSEKLGLIYVRHFYPSNKEVTRTIHLGSRYKGLDQLILNKQFEEAEAMILPETERKDFESLYKAAANMAILREAQGRTEEAEEWNRKKAYYLDQILKK